MLKKILNKQNKANQKQFVSFTWCSNISKLTAL